LPKWIRRNNSRSCQYLRHSHHWNKFSHKYLGMCLMWRTLILDLFFPRYCHCGHRKRQSWTSFRPILYLRSRMDPNCEPSSRLLLILCNHLFPMFLRNSLLDRNNTNHGTVLRTRMRSQLGGWFLQFDYIHLMYEWFCRRLYQFQHWSVSLWNNHRRMLQLHEWISLIPLPISKRIRDL